MNVASFKELSLERDRKSSPEAPGREEAADYSTFKELSLERDRKVFAFKLFLSAENITFKELSLERDRKSI